MSWTFPLIMLIAVGVLATALGIIFHINFRARRLDSRLGAFRCWSRPDTHSGWTSGIGQYDTETLSWYRLVALSWKPEYTVPRRGLRISAPIDHSTDGEVVEIRLLSGDDRYEMAVARQTYNALVSWVESGPPRLR